MSKRVRKTAASEAIRRTIQSLREEAERLEGRLAGIQYAIQLLEQGQAGAEEEEEDERGDPAT
jgi:prefoldin subunit 5